ncbi:MAG: N-terminal cleavage protein [Steroidobacteraceae bacterium]|jgi:type IV pilus assembly protein PilW|nr:N-terminal cleavage protein [Steroidobacteraceae bacterium]
MKRRHFRASGFATRQRAAGFSLIELMTAMLLSLLLIAATVSVFLSNKRVYGATEGLGRLQENARIAFELMSRDIREAGGNPCDVRMKVVNVLDDTTSWWATYDTDSGVFGYDGDFPDGEAGTDAIQIRFFEDTGVVTSAGMGGTTGQLAVSDIDMIEEQQILMACGFFSSSAAPVTDTAAVFSAGKASGAITHDEGSGNSSNDFSNAAHPTPVVFPANTLIGSLRAMEWYVAENDQGRLSLYRRQLRYPGTAPEMGEAEEIVDDVTGLTLTYLENDTWQDEPTSWNNVTAVQVDLELEESDSRAGGVKGELIKRKLTHVIALRNKL